MKIKVDYVTNSSSEVFGVVAGESAVASGLVGTLITLMKGCKNSSEGISGENIQTDGIVIDSTEAAEQLAQAAIDDAKRQEDIIKDAYKEAGDTLDSAKKTLEEELEECKKAWEESDKTADKTDPGYEKVNEQYKEYIEYLNSQIKKTEYQKQMIDYEKAKKQEELDSKNEWVTQQQKDYIAVKEEKAMLEAVKKGYNKPGYNTDAVKIRLEQLEQREKELSDTLSKNDASFEYTAKDRGTIGPSKESQELSEKIAAERERLETAKKESNDKRRKEIEASMEKDIEEYKAQIKKANRYDIATKAAEGTQFGADLAIEGLSYVTGPAGQKIKLAYTAGKNIGSGMGEGMADPKNAAKHLAKGILNAGTEVLKDKFGDDKPWQAAATEILNEGLQSGLDASIQGKDVVDAMGKGLTKGVVNVGTDKALDAIKGKLPIPKGSSVDVHDYSVGKILNNNPLTKGILKTGTREVVGSQIKDAIKGGVVDKLGKEGGFIDEE